LAVFSVHFLWNFAHSMVDEYRATQYQKAAARLLSQNKNDEALMNVQKALFLVPDHIASCRLMARLLDAQGDSRALEYYRFVALEGSILPSEIQLVDASSDAGAFFDGGGDVLRSGDRFLGVKEEVVLSPKATREDAMNLALAAVKYGRLVVGWDVANLLSLKWKDSVFPHLLRASINGKMGDLAAQELELRSALSKSENLETLMAFYEFLLYQPLSKPERSAELVRVLDQITKLNPSRKSLELCANTISSGSLEAADALGLIQIIRRHPASDPASLLFADKLQLDLQPDSRSPILQGLVKRLLALPPMDRLPAVDWLIDVQEPTLAQAALPLPDAIASTKTFEMWIEATILLKQWNTIDKALADPANPLPAYRTQALEATIAGIKGNPAKSRELWSAVLSKNRDRPDVFLELLISLIRVGEWKVLYQEMPALLNDQNWAFKAVQTLIPIARQYRDSTLMLEFYQQAMKSRIIANEETVKDRAGYTRLILGEAVPLEALESRSRKNPENASFRLTYALGLLKSGSKVKALFELKDVEPSIQVDALLPHQKAVYAAIVAANGEVEEAQGIIKTISPGSLTRQEEALVSDPSAANKAN
jgi:tetratricopeptide (TPR) repeat protein